MARDLRLMEYVQTCQVVRGSQAYDVIPFEGGVDPVVVKRPKVPAIITQSGSAKGFNARFVPPDPLFPDNLIDQPQQSSASPDGLVWLTTWTYVMAVDDGAIEDELIINACKWPDSPVFTTF